MTAASRRAELTSWSVGGAVHGDPGELGDLEVAGQPGREVSDELRSGAWNRCRPRRRTGRRPRRRVPGRRRAAAAPAPARRGDRRVEQVAQGHHPSRGCPGARPPGPGSGRWSAGILPDSEMPRDVMPVGHCARGADRLARYLETRLRSAHSVSSTAEASIGSPTHTSQRPQGSASSSSSASRRNCIRHRSPPHVVEHGLLFVPTGVADPRVPLLVVRPRARPVDIQPLATRRTTPSTSSTLSIISSRLRRSDTRGSSAGTEIGAPSRSSSASVCGRRARAGKASDPK